MKSIAVAVFATMAVLIVAGGLCISWPDREARSAQSRPWPGKGANEQEMMDVVDKDPGKIKVSAADVIALHEDKVPDTVVSIEMLHHNR